MPSRAVPIACCAALSLAVLTACEDQAPAPESIPTEASKTTTWLAPIDDAEATETPRVAALLPFAADQLIALGVQPVLVPTLPGGQPEAWQGIEAGALDHSVGPNVEQVIAADADVVIMSAVYTQFVPQIEETTDARVITMDADTLEDVSTHTRTIGELVGKPDQADAWIADFDAKLAATTPIESAGDPVSVLAVFGTPQAFYAFLPDSYLGDLVETAGGRLITSDLPAHRFYRGLAPLSMEAVVQKDPDVILVVFHGPERAARAMFDRDPLWGQLTAIKDDNIAFLGEDLFAMRSGSQAVAALEDVRTAIENATPAP
ncbi:MAG: ABC transporter substrate-binding protein [Phycisphaerales bacterium]|jgi:iron complex transport system substrate-binding protein